MITIYVDIDSVLADFLSKYRELYSDAQVKDNFSEFVSKGYFQNLNMMPNAHNLLFLLRVIESLYPRDINIEILGSLGRAKDLDKCASDKKIWLQKYGINWKTNFVVSKKYKKDFANCMAILIDDNVENCQQFIANGGMAIQYIDSEWDRMESEIKEIVMKKLQ